MAIKYCVDCGKPFNPGTFGSSEIRDSECNKKVRPSLIDDVNKYKAFKKNLKPPSAFPDDEQAMEYYQFQLNILLKMSNKSLDSLLSEREIAQVPSDAALLAETLSSYIEQVQGI